jgi:hypothetical protein
MLLGLQTAPKEDSGISVAGLVYGVVLSLPAEFLSTAELPATDFLNKLQHIEMPATRPLSYAEAAARPAVALLQARPATSTCGAAARCCPCQGGQVLPASSGQPRGDDQHRPPEAASGSGTVLGGPPGGIQQPPYLSTCGVPAAASSSSCDYGGPVAEENSN